jgi:dihydroneopterin aldolase
MSDSIFVTGLLIHAHHGVMEHEVTVHKPRAPMAVIFGDVGITLMRAHHD